MIIYPSLTATNSQYLNLITDIAFNPVNDIVLSVEFAISGNINTEAAMCFFVTTNSPLTGGGLGSDCIYSGIADTRWPAYMGVNDAVLGVALDSTGSFGLSADRILSVPSSEYNAATAAGVVISRDGYNDNRLIPNSIGLRLGYNNNYNLAPFNYYEQLQSFNLIGSDLSNTRALRFRVGDLGTKIHVDYKLNLSDDFSNITTFDIGSDIIAVNTFYKVGLSLVTPVTAISTTPNIDTKIGNFVIKKVHAEGRTTPATIQRYASGDSELWSTEYGHWDLIGNYWYDI